MNPSSVFSLTDHHENLSKDGDPLVLDATDFEYFRTWLVEGLGTGDGSKGADASAAKPAVAKPTAKAADVGTDAKGDTKIDEKKLEEFLKEKGEEELVEPHKSDESALDIDFFKLRRNMRFLQFQCEVGNSYNQEMREQFSEALQAFSRINVRYKEMHQRDAERLDLVSQVEKARLDLIDISDAKTRSEAELARTKASVDSNRKEHQAAISELEMDRDSARAEADGARAEIDAQKNEISVLRDALSEACDTIAQDMAARMMHESLLQELEDKVAQLEHEATMAGR